MGLLRLIPSGQVRANSLISKLNRTSRVRVREATIPAKNRDEVAAKMTPAQIAEAQRMGREWKPTK